MVHAAAACPLAALCQGRRTALFAALPVYLVRDTVGFAAFFGVWQEATTLSARSSAEAPPRARCRDLAWSAAAGGAAGAVYHVGGSGRRETIPNNEGSRNSNCSTC